MMAPAPTSPEERDADPPRRAEVDAATLRRCAAGDPIAFRAFVVRYQSPVFALLSRMTGRGAHLDDLAQDTFLKAFKALPGWDPAGPAQPSTWLLTIAVRVALDARKRRIIPVEPLRPEHHQPTGQTPESETERARLGRALEAAAAGLDEHQRAAFVLQEFHGFSVEAIAEALGIPPNTAKTRLYRARQRLREVLAKYREES